MKISSLKKINQLLIDSVKKKKSPKACLYITQIQFDKAIIIVIFILEQPDCVAWTGSRLCSTCAVVWCTWCSEEDGLSGSFLLDVGSEALEEFGIFSLGHGPQDRRRSPAARIHCNHNKQSSSQRSYIHTSFINKRVCVE